MSSPVKQWRHEYRNQRIGHIVSFNAQEYAVTIHNPGTSPLEPGLVYEVATSLEAAIDVADRVVGVDTEMSDWSSQPLQSQLTLQRTVAAGPDDVRESGPIGQYTVGGLPPDWQATIAHRPEEDGWRLAIRTPDDTDYRQLATFKTPEHAVVWLEAVIRQM